MLCLDFEENRVGMEWSYMKKSLLHFGPMVTRRFSPVGRGLK